MSGKKTGVKKKGGDAKGKDLNKCEKEINENGIEKENVPVVINEKEIHPPQHDSNSLDSKCSATSSSRGVSRRFSFGKGKKKNVDACVNGKKKGVGIRRSHSLNIFSKPDGRSRIPIFRQKNQNKNIKQNTKLLSSPRLQIATNYESRSLVLNPGMDSWRMAGLMDTVGKMNSVSAIDHLKTTAPNVVLASSLPRCTVESTEKVRDAETLSNELDYSTMVNDNNVFDPSPPLSSDIVPAITFTLNDEPENMTEPPVQTKVSSNTCSSNDISSQLHEETESEVVSVVNSCPNTSDVCGVEMSERVQLVVEDVHFESSPRHVEERAVVEEGGGDVVFSLDLTVQGTSTHEDDILSRVGYKSPDNGCVVATPPHLIERSDAYDRESEGHEYTIIQELYELDSENTISVRKLEDLVLETQIQMPKAVCCDDWLVLDFSHGDVIS